MGNLMANAVYLCGPEMSETDARRIATEKGFSVCAPLIRRGYALGWVAQKTDVGGSKNNELAALWKSAQGGRMAEIASEFISKCEPFIQRSLKLQQQILDEQDCEEIFASAEYEQRLQPKFSLMGSIYDEGDDQEIAKVEFDVIDNDEVVAENVWVKVSWLSFVDDDASLRFRFSFGMEQYEDVSADYQREIYAADLAERIFPESMAITQNKSLIDFLKGQVGKKDIEFVERIIYFNAPNGGAQFHQDVERGHLGVVFVQLYGRTAWFSLSKTHLLKEVKQFLQRDDAKSEIAKVCGKKTHITKLFKAIDEEAVLSEILDSMSNDAMESVLNRIPLFAQQLIEHGHGYIVNPGDAMLLPQDSSEHCAWHTVFCLDDYSGLALSFAIRERM